MGKCHGHIGCWFSPLERCQEDLHNTLGRQPSEQTMCQREILIYIQTEINRYMKEINSSAFQWESERKAGDNSPDFLAGSPPTPRPVCHSELLFLFLTVNFRNVLGMCSNLRCVCGASAVISPSQLKTHQESLQRKGPRHGSSILISRSLAAFPPHSPPPGILGHLLLQLSRLLQPLPPFPLPPPPPSAAP